MFNNEKQKLLEARTKALKEAEQKAEALAEHNKELSNERLTMIAQITTYRENERLILEIIEGNSYGRTDKQKLEKIKELVIDGKSIN